MKPIDSNSLLTEDQQRAMKAALALDGIDQRAFADKLRLDYYRLNRMLNGREPVAARYARALNSLLPVLSDAQAA